MTAEGDSSDRTRPDEEAPLLQERQLSDDDEQSPTRKDTTPKTRSWYLWRIFWALLAVSVLAVFVKGWVDAGGDVEVSTVIPNWQPRTPMPMRHAHARDETPPTR